LKPIAFHFNTVYALSGKNGEFVMELISIVLCFGYGEIRFKKKKKLCILIIIADYVPGNRKSQLCSAKIA
jgi:hypothetical protein